MVCFVASVVRAFEKNDFFDSGITKAQLFLSVHDAALFAMSRKFLEPSELSLDESETVIQETYSESEKVGGPGASLWWVQGAGLKWSRGLMRWRGPMCRKCLSVQLIGVGEVQMLS